MTKINNSEYEQFASFDQCLVWAVTTLAAANRNEDNKDLINNVAIRPGAIDYVDWTVKLDEDGEPFLVFSALFPLIEYSPLVNRSGLAAKIPNYTDFQPPPELLSLPAMGQGLPAPPIPTEITTLERLLCWLCMIANQHGDFIRYCGTANLVPPFTIDARGLTYDKPVNESLLEAIANGISISIGGSTNAAAAFEKLSGEPPEDRNQKDLQNKIDDARDESRANSEPPQVAADKGYGRIDTLPVCKDQDPSIKAFNKPLRDILK